MSDKPVILVIDDEAQIRRLLELTLESSGYAVRSVGTGKDGIAMAASERPEVIILDLGLPDLDGVEVLKKVREWSAVPVLILSVRDAESDIIACLDAGADDYLTKPFSVRELVARIKAVLRRSTKTPSNEEQISVGDLVINAETYSVMKRGVTLSLSPTEFKLLMFLVERKGKIYNREQLLNAVWKDEGYVEPRTVDVHISRIRTQIEDDPANPVYIKTRRGHGYYFEDNLPERD